MLTENRRIEKARTPIRRRIKNARTLPKACLIEDTPFWASEAAIDGQIELWRERMEAKKKKERESFSVTHWGLYLWKSLRSRWGRLSYVGEQRFKRPYWVWFYKQWLKYPLGSDVAQFCWASYRFLPLWIMWLDVDSLLFGLRFRHGWFFILPSSIYC